MANNEISTQAADTQSQKMVGSYDVKADIADDDTLLGYDTTNNKVKNFKFSGIWNWFISKAKKEKVDALNTTDKTLTGAINEVYSPTFSTASARENIKSGETQSVLMGKISKWFTSLGTAAFCKVVNGLTETAEGGVLDARQGKALNDALGKLNTLMGSATLSTTDKTVLGAINELNSKKMNSNSLRIYRKDYVVNLTELIKNMSAYDICFFHLNGSGYTGNDLPTGKSYNYGSGIIFYRGSSSCKILLFSETDKPIWKLSSWTKWRDLTNSEIE